MWAFVDWGSFFVVVSLQSKSFSIWGLYEAPRFIV